MYARLINEMLRTIHTYSGNITDQISVKTVIEPFFEILGAQQFKVISSCSAFPVQALSPKI